ncbi:MAG: hypothetical protein CME64_07530 [Halobacteriovoraceae bacterium]|nr:hypothetical protein [Halobacteriovoraceae bacterium]|tara:strand:- start:52970 stop:54700 length:1731 start_codon:yes stop_codon:yes gene_type:complete
MRLKLLMAIFYLFCSAELWAAKLCKGVEVDRLNEIEFTDTEKRLLCGDQKLGAWEKIPAYQAQFFMRSFLQSRGYLSPHFSIKDETLYVTPGPIQKLKKINLLPEELIEEDKIENQITPVYQGLAITPKLLDQTQNSVITRLRQNAYACAEAKSLVLSNSSEVVVQASNLQRYKFGEIDLDLAETEILSNAMERFYPFESEQAFDSRLLKLTEKRIVRSGVAQATFFIEDCSDNALDISQGFIWGPPRVLRFGVGASTEVGPMLRISWANNRYKEMASNLSAKLQASFREQSLELESDFYHWPEHPRRSINSELEVSRESQNDFEEVNLAVSSSLKWSRDSLSRYWSWSAGPVFTQGFYNSDFEETSRSYEAFSLEAGIQSMSHDFEIFDFHPQEGNSFFSRIEHRPKEFGFDNTLTRIGAGGTFIENLTSSGRGRIIGAMRLLGQTGLVDNTVELEKLPPSVKYYGGGSNDLRGFQLKSRPKNNGLGALTKLLMKTELRRTHFFIPSLEGVLFYDVARFGERSTQLSNQTFHSPGVGVRWMSPIGLAQIYYAQAITTSPSEEKDELVYAGLGGEF